MKNIIAYTLIVLVFATIICGVWYLGAWLRKSVNYKVLYKPMVEKTVYEILEKEGLLDGR